MFSTFTQRHHQGAATGGMRRGRRRLYAVPAVVACAAGLVACSSGSSTPASLDQIPPDTVVVTGMRFTPAQITVHVGDEVTWLFRDNGIPHDVTSTDPDGTVSSDPVLDSGQQTRGDYTHTFTEPGSYDYICTIHPDMKGVVTVEP